MKVRYYERIYNVQKEIKLNNGRSYYGVLINGEMTLLNSWNDDLEVI